MTEFRSYTVWQTTTTTKRTFKTMRDRNNYFVQCDFKCEKEKSNTEKWVNSE